MRTITFPVTTPDEADSGMVVGQGSYPPPPTGVGFVYVSVARAHDPDGRYRVVVGLLRFDTSALPASAVITAASLKMQRDVGRSVDGLNLVGEFYDPANWPIDFGDYTVNAPAVPILSVPLANIPAIIPLTAYSGINRNGYTGFRFHSDKIAGELPTGNNEAFFQGNDPLISVWPQLVVEYYEPLTATVIASATAMATPQITVHASGMIVGRATTNLAVQLNLTGTSTGAASVSTDLHVTHSVTATLSAQAAAAAALSIIHHCAGAGQGVALVSGAVVASRQLSGELDATAHAAATLHLSHVLAGNLSGAATMFGGLEPIVHLPGALIGQASIAAAIKLVHHVSGVSGAAAIDTAQLHLFVHLIGPLLGVATTNAPLLHYSKFLTATSTGRAAVNATITKIIRWNVEVSGQALVAGQIRKFDRMRTVVRGQALVRVALNVVPLNPPPGPPIIHTIDCEPLTGVHAAPGCTPLASIHAIARDG